jgi:hypothetical protein
MQLSTLPNPKSLESIHLTSELQMESRHVDALASTFSEIPNLRCLRLVVHSGGREHDFASLLGMLLRCARSLRKLELVVSGLPMTTVSSTNPQFTRMATNPNTEPFHLPPSTLYTISHVVGLVHLQTPRG